MPYDNTVDPTDQIIGFDLLFTIPDDLGQEQIVKKDEEDKGYEPNGAEDPVGLLDRRIVKVTENLPELRERCEHDRAVLLHLGMKSVFALLQHTNNVLSLIYTTSIE